MQATSSPPLCGHQAHHPAEMLSFGSPTIYQQSKCFFSHGRMGHLDPNQLPTDWAKKGKPWSTVLAQDFLRRASKLARRTRSRTPQNVSTNAVLCLDRSRPAAGVVGAPPRAAAGARQSGLCARHDEPGRRVARRLLHRVHQDWWVTFCAPVHASGRKRWHADRGLQGIS